MSETTTRPPAAPSRLPRTRESRPVVLGLAILLIVGGAVASAYLAIQSGHRAYFVAIAREVPQGSTISKDDLRRVSLPEDFRSGVRYADAGTVVGKTATTRLLADTVVNPGMLSSRGLLRENQVSQTFPVDRDKISPALKPGDQLAITVDADQQTVGDAVLADVLAVVRDSSGSGLTAGGNQTVTVSVAFDRSCRAKVARAVQQNTVVLSTYFGSAADAGSGIKKVC